MIYYKVVVCSLDVKVLFFLSGACPFKHLSETQEAGGPYPGAGGTLTRVLSVHSEFSGLNIKYMEDIINYFPLLKKQFRHYLLKTKNL